MVSSSPFQCPTCIMGSDWWTVRRWSASRPSAFPQQQHQSSAWPGFLLPRACSSQEVTATQAGIQPGTKTMSLSFKPVKKGGGPWLQGD